MSGVSAAGNVNSGRNLPVYLGPRQERRRGERTSVTSDFASQLIAARDNMPVQRARRRADGDIAHLAYDWTGHLDERRMPQGYRLDLSA